MRTRPKRKELFRAAIDLAADGSTFRATARRYSLCQADADDAYQRSLEILMTRAPSRDRSDLAPWLQTVIKHEALAIRRERERILGGEHAPDESAIEEEGESPEELAPERERVRRSAEALAQLKPGEIQCLLLKAVGYSYDEISAKTGFSWTKVNRSISEGRKRFFERFAQLESGAHCGRFRSLLSSASDGEAAPDEERLLKAHLRACPGCRAALRDYRTIPARVAELLPPAALLPALEKESWWTRAGDSLAFWIADRGGAIGHKLQQVGDAVSAQKATAVVASTAALTGGAVVHERVVDQPRSHMRQDARRPTGPPAAGTVRSLPDSRQQASATPRGGPLSDGPKEAATDPAATAEEFSPEQAMPQPASPDQATNSSSTELAGMAAGSESEPHTTATASNDGAAGAGQEFGP